MNIIAGIIINADIVDPSQYVLKNGAAKGLLRLEMSIDDVALQKIMLAFPSYYGTQKSSLSYSGLSRKNSASVDITLVLGLYEYEAILKIPEKQTKSWIPNGPVYDNTGNDIKLAGALCQAGFPVRQWTFLQTSQRLTKHKQMIIQSVQFEVMVGVWKYHQPSSLTLNGVNLPFLANPSL